MILRGTANKAYFPTTSYLLAGSFNKEQTLTESLPYSGIHKTSLPHVVPHKD